MRHLVAPAALVALGALLTSACQARESPDPTPSAAPRVTSIATGTLDSYCEVQELRRLVREGDVERSRLPSFADRTEVDGAPLIVDFTRQPRDGAAAAVGRLVASPGLRDVRLDRTRIESCLETTTDADIEESQGGPGYQG